MAVAVGEQRRKREAMDLLVSEIAKGEEENISLSLRTAIERGWVSNFMDSLTDAKKKKDAEIDRICSRHYGDFLTSVNEMLRMRGSAGHLTDQVNEVHSQFSSTGGDLVKVLDDLNKIQLERENTRQLLESTLHCKEIAAMMVTTKKQIEADDHYNAMRSIEMIKEEAKVLTVKPMVKCLENWLPIATNKLLYSAKGEADIFLQMIRKKIEVIGSTILIRQGQVSAYNTNQDIISANTNKLHRQFSNDAALEDQNAMLSTRSSISLKYIRSNGTVFGLNKWASPKEFDSLVPQHFLQSPSETGVELVDNSLCDIGPLHKVLHLYAVLGNLAAYHEHYRSSREVFFVTLLKTAERGANQYGLSAAIPRYFDSLVGFFTIECAHRRSVEISDGAFSYAELSALWDRACAHINTLCFNLAITLTSPDVLLSIKEEVLLLIDVMCDESFGFKPAGLYEVMKNLWEVFEGLQIQSMVRACTAAMEQCAYQPFYVTSQEVFNKQVRAYRLDTIKLNDEAQFTRTKDSRLKSLERERAQTRSENAAANLDALEDELMGGGKSSGGGAGAREQMQFADEPSPQRGGGNSPMGGRRMNRQNSTNFIAQTFPFSGVVPVLIRQFHSLIVRYFIYAVKNHHLGSRGEEICNAVVAAYQTISKSFSAELAKDGSETPLSKACQISIDAGTLALASEAIWLLIENALKQFRWTEKLDIYISKAIDRSISQLRMVVTQSQDMIFELLSNKIEDLLGSLVFINFEPDTLPNGPHESIEEIIEFLRITFMCLTHLPLSVREAAHFTCCSRVANGIMGYILSPKVTRINILCVLAFENDVKRLIQFSDSCGISHLKQCFEEFQELVRCLLSSDLHFLAENAGIRGKLLTRLTVGKFVQVLDKMVPTVLTNATQHLPRMEKTMVKGLVKKLKSLPPSS